MKKIIFILLFLPALLHAQDTASFKHNELKLNVGYLIGGYIEVNYERLLSDESAAGISLGSSVDDGVDFTYGIVPYYRVYFGRKAGSGFFAEANLAFYNERRTEYHWQYPVSLSYEYKKDYFGGGAGFAVGGKFISKKGFLVELYVGIGRNFFNTDRIEVVYPRFGISIGKRF